MALARGNLPVRGNPGQVSEVEKGLIDIPDELIVNRELVWLLLNDYGSPASPRFFKNEIEIASSLRAPRN